MHAIIVTLIGIGIISLLTVAMPYIIGAIVVGIILLSLFGEKNPATKDSIEEGSNDDADEFGTTALNSLESKSTQPEPPEPKTIHQDKEFVQPKKRDYRKEKGIAYERHIGKRFEDKDELVIYNGLIQDYEDGGVDLVSISIEEKTLNLVQCKNWNYRTIEVEHIQKIYRKLHNHNLDFLHLPTNQIKSHLNTKKDDSAIQKIIAHVQDNLDCYTIRKTLYISSDKVVDLEIGKFLTMIKPHIFRYEDMKIVVERISNR